MARKRTKPSPVSEAKTAKARELAAKDEFFDSADGRAAVSLEMPLNDMLLRNRMEYVFMAGIAVGRKLEREGWSVGEDQE
jgi:hypothetical protein